MVKRIARGLLVSTGVWLALFLGWLVKSSKDQTYLSSVSDADWLKYIQARENIEMRHR